MITILLYIDLFTLSPKNLNLETSYLKSIDKKYTKIKFNRNLFNKNSRKEKEKTKFNNKNKLASLDIENFFIYKRINNATSIYPSKNFQKDFERSQTYKTNICKLPKINFKKLLKSPIKSKDAQKKLYKYNYDNYNFSTVNTNITNVTLTSNNKYNFNYDEIDDMESILLYIYINSNLKEHPYTIISSPDDLFCEVIKKLRETIPFMKKDNIIAFKYENEKKSEIQMFKNLKENGLKDRSKILIEYE